MDSDAMRQAYQRAINDTPNYNDWGAPKTPALPAKEPEFVLVTDDTTCFIATKHGNRYDIIGTTINTYYANRILKALNGVS